MKTRNNYYEISKEGDFWIAETVNTITGNTIVLKRQLLELKQYGVALIAKTHSNTYDLYLPEQRFYGRHGSQYFYDPTLVLTDIKSYQYFDTSKENEVASGIFMLQKEDYYTFIKTDLYSCYISQEGTVRGRKENLPKLYCKKIEFLKEFSYIGPDDFIVRTESSDYLLRFYCSNVYGTESQTAVVDLKGRAAAMPDFTRQFIVTTEIGQYMHTLYLGDDKNPEVFGSIKPFSEEDKILLLKSSKDCGYWFYDSGGSILRMVMFDSQKSLGSNSYRLNFDHAKSISFIKRYTFNKSEKIFLDIWKIDYANGDQKLLLHCKGNSIFADISDFQ